MTTHNMVYDHPAYTSVDCSEGSCTGNAGTTTKFVAYTAKLVKSITLKPTTAPGASDVVSFIQISGTTTTTTALATFGSGATTFTNVALSSAANGGASLLQGDTYYVVNGTDTAGTIAVSIEYVIPPLSNFTL